MTEKTKFCIAVVVSSIIIFGMGFICFPNPKISKDRKGDNKNNNRIEKTTKKLIIVSRLWDAEAQATVNVISHLIDIDLSDPRLIRIEFDGTNYNVISEQ